MKQYQTIQGDMWDSIAKKVYGTEKAMELLMQANPAYLDTAVFCGGCDIASAPIYCTGAGKYDGATVEKAIVLEMMENEKIDDCQENEP